MTDSMGKIVDRTEEHLGTTDTAIIRMRRRLIMGARDLAEGIEPYAASHPEVFRSAPAARCCPRGLLQGRPCGLGRHYRHVGRGLR